MDDNPLEGEIVELTPQQKPRKRRPTQKQMLAVGFRAQGHSKRKSALLAGYTPDVANNAELNVFQAKAVKMMIETMREKLSARGLTTDYMAKKMEEWIEAKDDKGNPDYETQLKAHKEWKEYLFGSDGLKPGQVKKKITFEEIAFSKPEGDEI